MFTPKRALVALFLVLAVVITATPSAARPWAPRQACERRYTIAMFHRAATATYTGTRLPRKGAYGRLWRYLRCQRHPWGSVVSRAIWTRAFRAWVRRRNPPLPYGIWAIPAAIVRCESHGRNLPPNSASASGYYQILRSTWDHYRGYAAAYLAPKHIQDMKAAALWAGGHGASQWVCTG